MNRESPLPFFSIVVPSYNRPGPLAVCLESLARLDYPRDRFEVIVVDDGGELGLEAVVAALCDRLALILLRQANAGPGIARNTGAAHARGQFLAFIDDDCMAAADWLRVLAARCRATPNRAIGGRTINALPANPYSTASQVLVDYVYAYYNADRDRARFFASNNLVVPAARFRTVGGFATRWPYPASEDREFCDRWLHCGHQMSYVPEALVYHGHPLTLRSFWRQHFSYGRGAFGFHRARAGRRPGGLRADFPFRLHLPLHPLLSRQGRRAPWLAALLVISQVASAAGCVWEWLRWCHRLARRDGIPAVGCSSIHGAHKLW